MFEEITHYLYISGVLSKISPLQLNTFQILMFVAPFSEDSGKYTNII